MKSSKKMRFEQSFLEKDMMEILEHSMIVSRLAYLVGKEMDFSETLCHELAVAGMMHDIGKILLDSFMEAHQNKGGKTPSLIGESQLDREGVQYVRMHSKFSCDILKAQEYSDIILDTVLYHHENYDGTGYPEGLLGTDIPMGARILRVCDAFAALVGDRIYREAFDVDTAVAIMIDDVKNFDMRVFLAFQRVIHEVDVDEFFEMLDEDLKNGSEENIGE